MSRQKKEIATAINYKNPSSKFTPMPGVLLQHRLKLADLGNYLHMDSRAHFSILKASGKDIAAFSLSGVAAIQASQQRLIAAGLLEKGLPVWVNQNGWNKKKDVLHLSAALPAVDGPAVTLRYSKSAALLPNAVLSDCRLSQAEKGLWSLLRFFKMGLDTTINWLCQFAGDSRRTIERTFASLVQKRFIQSHDFGVYGSFNIAVNPYSAADLRRAVAASKDALANRVYQRKKILGKLPKLAADKNSTTVKNQQPSKSRTIIKQEKFLNKTGKEAASPGSLNGKKEGENQLEALAFKCVGLYGSLVPTSNKRVLYNTAKKYLKTAERFNFALFERRTREDFAEWNTTFKDLLKRGERFKAKSTVVESTAATCEMPADVRDYLANFKRGLSA